MQTERGERSIVVLTEEYSQICNMIGGELVFLEREEHLRLLQKRVEMLEQLNAWINKLGSDEHERRGVFFVLERFHLNHRVFWSWARVGSVRCSNFELSGSLTGNAENRRFMSNFGEGWAV